MKKTLTLSLFAKFLFLALIFSSCSKDDDPEPKIKNEFQIGDETLTIDYGILVDFGSFDPIGSDNESSNHYNYYFVLTNGEPGPYEDYWQSESNTYRVYFELFSNGSEGFKPGTFTYLNKEKATKETIKNKSFFFDVDYSESDNFKSDEAGDKAIGGTVKVSKGQSEYEYIIEFELELASGKTLKGAYSGVFKFVCDNKDCNNE
ncbi:hypothetical protein AAG747_15610 [Rapidithrix thailandica]|uniref:Lipoprotein n=1 Tax=Rapidithrix thailandica TaxID=413964 RepID=A0AAW9SC36_9BACT